MDDYAVMLAQEDHQWLNSLNVGKFG
jgi:hypothetical protein